MARKKKVQQIVSFVLDETGSMSGYKSQTIAGFNEYLTGLKAEKNAAIKFTLTQFNSNETKIVHDSVSIKDVPELTDTTYVPRACTPLYDAIGATIVALDNATKGKDVRVLVAIQTDGLENASKEYSRDDIMTMIEECKKEGWTFVFLGADIDAYEAGHSLGISQDNIMQYSSSQSRAAFQNMAVATSNYMSGSVTNTEPDEKFFNSGGG